MICVLLFAISFLTVSASPVSSIDAAHKSDCVIGGIGYNRSDIISSNLTSECVCGENDTISCRTLGCDLYGQLYEIGTVVTSGPFIQCSCVQDQLVNCTEQPGSTGNLSSSVITGGLHIRTFDGVWIGAGPWCSTYTLVRTDKLNINATVVDGVVEVITVHVAQTQQVLIDLYKNRTAQTNGKFTYRKTHTVHLPELLIVFSEKISLDYMFSVWKLQIPDLFLEITWNDYGTVEFIVTKSLTASNTGLAGSSNDKPGDDYANTEEDFIIDNTANIPCSSVPRSCQKNSKQQECSVIKDAVFSSCLVNLPAEAYVDICRAEVCITPSGYCSAIQTYSTECSRMSVQTNWEIITGKCPKDGEMNMDENLVSGITQTDRSSLLKTITIQRDGECDLTQALISNCNINVGTSDSTFEIKKNTAMANVAINCQITKLNCFKLKAGYTLKIVNTDITGSGNGRFLEMEAGSRLFLDVVKGEGFGRLTSLSGSNIYGGFIKAAANYKLNIKNTEVKNNKGYSGGGLHLTGAGELNVLESVFISNEMGSGDGGAIYGSGDSSDKTKASWYFKESIFKKNIGTSSGTDGAGIWAQYVTATLANTEIIENENNDEGAGVCLLGSSFKFQCSLLALNVNRASYGGAIWGDGNSDITLIKSLVVGNKDSAGNDDIYCSSSSTTIKTDLYSTSLKTTTACKYDYIPPYSDQNVYCIPQ